MTAPSAPPSNAPALSDAPLLSDAIGRLARTGVLVVGDVMLDRCVGGRIDPGRAHPAGAGMLVLRVEREVATLGGAGNVVRNLTALGAAVSFVSVVGDDQAGADLTGLIGGQPNVEPWLLVQGGRATTQKTRFEAPPDTDGGLPRVLLRADREDAAPIHPKLAERLVRIVADTLVAASVLLLSDYGKGVLDGGVAEALIAAARAAGRPVVVDPRGADYARYAGAALIAPNRADLAAATGCDISDEACLVEAAARLRERYGFGAVLVTRGADGMTILDEAGCMHLPARTRAALDLAGVGDTCCAALAAGLAGGLGVRMAAAVANLAAGCVVTRPGTAVATIADLRAMAG